MRDNKKAVIMILMAGGTFILVAIMLFSMFRDRPSSIEEDASNIEIPDAVVEDMPDKKLDSYRKQGPRNIDQYWDDSESETDDIGDVFENDSNTGSVSRDQKSYEELHEEDVWRSSNSRSDSGQSGSHNTSSQSSTVRQTGAERMKQYQESRDSAVLAALGTPKDTSNVQTQVQEPPTANIGRSASIKRTGIVSSLGDESSSEISSLDDYDDCISQDENYPFQCMFVREAKLKSGSRVAIRLLEDMLVNGVLVSKNTHLMALCSLDNRVKLTINSIEINGKIYQLNYEAYDVDGGLGIYCPELKTDATKQAKSSGFSIFNNLIGGRVGNVAREITNTGVAIANSIGGEVTVVVPAGYTFFIVKKTN